MWLGVRCRKDKLALVVVRNGTPRRVAFARRQAAPDVEDLSERAAGLWATDQSGAIWRHEAPAGNVMPVLVGTSRWRKR